MNQMSDSSRRAFLAALAASGVGAAALPGIVHAESGSGGGISDGTSTPSGGPSFRTEAFPAPTPGTYYTFVLGGEFQPSTDTYPYTKNFGEIRASTGGTFYASLAGLPPGAQITEVTFAVVKSATFTGDTSVNLWKMSSGAILLLNSQTTAALGQLPDEQYVSLTVANTADWVIDNEQTSTMWLVLNMSGISRVNGVRIGWTLARPRTFIPIDPKRVYDSRFIAPVGPLNTNESRVVSVANSFAPNGSTPDVTDVVPAGAKAISYNLTIVNTTASGFLSVTPGDAAAAGGSSINWFQSGMILANGLTGKLDTNRQVRVFCGGGGSTDFLIDVVGYYI